MENYSNEGHTPCGGYRGAPTVQPLEALNGLQASSPEGYYPPSGGGYQQQEQLYGSQQHYGYQQQYLAPSAGYTGPYARTSMGMRAPAAGC
jgi:hypothetical protein